METTIPVNNGVNVDALLEAREALSEAPEAAQFTWRATCEWINGTHSRSNVEGFFGLGEEHQHKTNFTFEADHPEVFASEDHGATPVELVLAGLLFLEPEFALMLMALLFVLVPPLRSLPTLLRTKSSSAS